MFVSLFSVRFPFFDLSFQHELLNKPSRILLKGDAIPTIFVHNARKQPQKRKSRVLRKEARAKRQLCEDPLIHQELVDNFEFECITKETQTEITENFSNFQFETHTAKAVDFGMQCCIEIFEEQPSCTLDMFETETESKCCQESDVFDNEEDKQITSPSKAAFIVYWTSLIVLLKECLRSTCPMLATIINLAFKGSQLIVRLKCHKWV